MMIVMGEAQAEVVTATAMMIGLDETEIAIETKIGLKQKQTGRPEATPMYITSVILISLFLKRLVPFQKWSGHVTADMG